MVAWFQHIGELWNSKSQETWVSLISCENGIVVGGGGGGCEGGGGGIYIAAFHSGS